MNEMKKWGILGCGRIAHAFAESLKELPDAKLEAVASQTKKSEIFGKKFQVEKRYFRTIAYFEI